MSQVVYLDTSAVLRAVFERGMSRDVEEIVGGARFLATSRLSVVESARALQRLRTHGVAEDAIAVATAEVESIWARCAIWEITAAICHEAAVVAPGVNLRALDAIHLATFRRVRDALGADVTLLTTDERMLAAAGPGEVAISSAG